MAVENKIFVKGVFCWADLNTTDPAGARAFYQGLFGWAAQEFPMPDGSGTYLMMNLGGKNVGGIAPLAEEARKMGAPPHWMNFIAVEDPDSVAKKAQELGGKVLAGPFDLPEMGRMAVIEDPTGAVFSLWKSLHPAAGDFGGGEPGHVCWQELMTTDAEAAKRFYTGLFDYTAEAMPGAEGSAYTIFKTTDPEKPTEAGMMPIGPDMGPMPSNWGLYFSVTGADETAKKAESLGGKVIAPPSDIPNVGRFAILQDPQGAVFGILQGQQ